MTRAGRRLAHTPIGESGWAASSRRRPAFGLGVEISCRVYGPRRPRESPLFRLVEQHIEELTLVPLDREGRELVVI